MYKQDLALQLGGRLRYTRFVVTYQDLQAISGSGAQAINVTDNDNSAYTLKMQFPSVIIGAAAVLVTKFTGGAISAMTMSMGVSGATTGLINAFNLFQTPTATTYVDEAGLFYHGGTTAAITPILTFTPTSDVLANCTAGEVDIYLLWVDETTTFTEPT